MLSLFKTGWCETAATGVRTADRSAAWGVRRLRAGLAVFLLLGGLVARSGLTAGTIFVTNFAMGAFSCAVLSDCRTALVLTAPSSGLTLSLFGNL